MGEILHSIFNEIAGPDPQNRRILGTAVHVANRGAALEAFGPLGLA